MQRAEETGRTEETKKGEEWKRAEEMKKAEEPKGRRGEREMKETRERDMGEREAGVNREGNETEPRTPEAAAQIVPSLQLTLPAASTKAHCPCDSQ